MPYSRARHHNGHLRLRRRMRLRRKTKDLDQVSVNLCKINNLGISHMLLLFTKIIYHRLTMI